MVGLSSFNSDAGYTSIAYGISLHIDRIIHVFENGIDKGGFGAI